MSCLFQMGLADGTGGLRWGLRQWRVEPAGPDWVILTAGGSLLSAGSGSRMTARGSTKVRAEGRYDRPMWDCAKWHISRSTVQFCFSPWAANITGMCTFLVQLHNQRSQRSEYFLPVWLCFRTSGLRRFGYEIESYPTAAQVRDLPT